MGMSVDFKIVDCKNEKVMYLNFETSELWFLIPYFEHKNIITPKELDEGIFERFLSFDDLLQLKDFILTTLENPSEYKCNSELDRQEDIGKMLKCYKIINNLFLFDFQKIKVRLEMDW